MSVLEMAAGAVEEPRPVTDPSLDIRVLQRPTLVQPKVPKPLQENPAEANRFLVHLHYYHLSMYPDHLILIM